MRTVWKLADPTTKEFGHGPVVRKQPRFDFSNDNPKNKTRRSGLITCPAPDDSIDPKRYTLLMARAVMRSLIDAMLSTYAHLIPQE